MSEPTPPPIANTGKARQKQTLVTTAIAVLVFGGIMLGLYLSDPQRQITAQSDQVSSDEEVTENFSLPGQQVDPREVWISRGEADISQLKQSNTEFIREIEGLRQDIATLRQDQARSNRNNATSAMPSGNQESSPTAFPALPLPPPPKPRPDASDQVMDSALSNAAGNTARNLGLQRPAEAATPRRRHRGQPPATAAPPGVPAP